MGIFDYSVFFLTLFGLLLVPGWFLLRALFGTFRTLTAFEAALFSVLAGLGLLDFLMLLLDHLRLPLTRWSVLAGLAVACSACLMVVFLRSAGPSVSLGWKRLFRFEPMRFSVREGVLFALLLGLTVFVKTVFLASSIVPTATDLGHHMYWSKVIAATGAIPEYAKREILEEDGRYRVSEPQPIDDFIVGEHLPFAALALVSGADFVSAFPALTLFAIHLLSILAVTMFAYRLVPREGSPITPERVALWTLFFLGPLYAIASPQAKFVSGGVVGNMFGNLLIPLLLLAFFRALRERSAAWFGLGLFGSLVLAYTHHLSTLVFLFVAVFSLLIYGVFHFRDLRQNTAAWFRLAVRPWPLAVIVFGLGVFFLVAAPSYADRAAIDTAIGAPSKTTRTGLQLIQLGASAGYDRLGLGLFGLAAVFFLFRRESLSKGFALGWPVSVLTMTLAPEWVMVDVPSNRVAAYAAFPLALCSGFALALLASKVRPAAPAGALLLGVLVFSFVAGWNDNAQSLPTAGKDQAMAETYRAADYLATHLGPDDTLLKDHNYLTADTWMKLWFLRDYNYPFSRALLGRYEDEVTPREQCTLHMIASPNRPEGVRCFEETGVNAVMVHPDFDSAQFARSPLFNLVYRSEGVAVYLRDR